MTNTSCTILDSGTLQYTCESGDNDLDCTEENCVEDTYDCWGPFWDIHFTINSNSTYNNTPVNTTIKDPTRYTTLSEALHKMSEYAKGENYEVWYDTLSPQHARWTRPNPSSLLGAMIAGYVILFVGIVGGLVVRRTNFMSYETIN